MEQQVEEAEPILAAGRQHLSEVGLEVAGSAGTGAVVVETPEAAVGQESPPDSALRLDVSRREVPENLAVGRPGLASGVPVAGIKVKTEPLALLHHYGVPESFLRVGSPGGALLGCGIGEEEIVGDVLVASCPLLRKVVGPSQELQDRANQLLLGDGLVGAFGAAQRIAALTNAIPKCGKCRRARDGRAPLGGRLYAFGQEVVREQIGGHVSS